MTQTGIKASFFFEVVAEQETLREVARRNQDKEATAVARKLIAHYLSTVAVVLPDATQINAKTNTKPPEEKQRPKEL